MLGTLWLLAVDVVGERGWFNVRPPLLLEQHDLAGLDVSELFTGLFFYHGRVSALQPVDAVLQGVLLGSHTVDLLLQPLRLGPLCLPYPHAICADDNFVAQE